jgi:hypothetical protein
MTNGMGQTIAPKSASSAERSKKQTVDRAFRRLMTTTTIYSGRVGK